MKKFLIAGSGLVAVAAAGSAGAVDVTLGGSIDMGVEYGVGKNKSNLTFGDAYADVTLSIAAAGTTDGGIKYGGSFSLATAGELKFNFYDDNGTKKHFKYTVKNYTDLEAAAYNVSGGQKLNEDEIVAVKINSEWHNVSNNTRTLHGYPLLVSGNFDPINSTNICKVAGRAANAVEAPLAAPAFVNAGAANVALAFPASGTSNLGVARANAAGTKITDVNFIASTATAVPMNGYLPAGRLTQFGSAPSDAVVDDTPGAPALANLILTAGTSAAMSANVGVSATTAGVIGRVNLPDAEKNGTKGLDDKFNVYLADPDADGFVQTTADGAVIPDFQVDAAGDNNHDMVASAAVYAGPFAEVRMASSTTKMVIGAVCVTGRETSDTAFYMDNDSNVVTASGAKIFVDGGFGKLTLQTSDYAGKVSAIGDAGDEAEIDADGLVVIAEGVGFLGANPYVAVDMSGTTTNLELLTGGSFNMGALSATVDAKLGDGTDLLTLTTWDLGLDYSMGDASVAMALDSANDWGMKASMDIAGISASATVYNKATEAHKKNGLFYDISASTSVNGFALSLGVDQDMKPTVGLGYDMGDLNIYAGYDAADEGGKMGAKLSF